MTTQPAASEPITPPYPHLRTATAADLPTLAQMNQALIRAEGSRNPFTLAQLEARLAGWLADDSPTRWRVVVIDTVATSREPATSSGSSSRAGDAAREVVGYAVFRIQPDDYDPTRSEVHVRQLFVSDAARGSGIGRQVVAQLLTDWFPAGAAITVETLASNPRATAFWQQVGFEPYAMTLRREP